MQQIKSLIIPLTLVAFSFFINFIYSSKGVLPIDSFAHFDTGFRLTKGEVPFKDYWTTSGPLIDIFQSFLFNLYGVSWLTYTLNGSIINSFITIFLFFFLREIKIEIKYSFFYSLCFSILANPSMGAPFVDHYSTFFSLMSIICFIFAIRKDNFYFWFLIPIFLFLGFFCKQTPSGYVFILMVFNLILFSSLYKNFKWLKPILFGTIICIIIFLCLILLYQIEFKQFFLQYFLFPSTIGELRLEKIEFTLKRIIFDFKFIHFLLLPLFLLTIKNILNKKENKYLIFLNLNFVILSSILIFHQLLTLNFIYIFFLVPLLAAVMHSNFIFLSFKNSILRYILIILCVVGTTKFHLRFNEERKMINLEGIKISNYEKAETIDKKLKGLKWITMHYPNEPKKEVKFLKNSLKIIDNENSSLMFIGNYQFFSAILEKDLNAPNRWYATKISHPSEENKYYYDYVNFIKRIIVNKKIKIVYLHEPIKEQHLSVIQDAIALISKNCENLTNKSNEFVVIKIGDCN